MATLPNRPIITTFVLMCISGCVSQQKSQWCDDSQARKAVSHYSGVLLQPNDLSWGGISAIDFEPVSNQLYVISDNRSETGAARIFQLDLTNEFQIQSTRGAYLSYGLDSVLSGKEVDAEAIRLHPDGWAIWSSEMPVKQSGVYITNLEDGVTRPLDIPSHVQYSDEGTTGYRPNQFIEGISFTPDYKYLFLALEAPLFQDDELPTTQRGADTRLLLYRVADFSLLAEYVVRLDPVPLESKALPKLQDNGISEILALDTEKLFILERSGSHVGDYDFDFNTRLYCVYLEEATNIKGVDSISLASDKTLVRATKSPLNWFNGDPIELFSNFEGVTLRFDEEHGFLLYLISDDNFSDKAQTELLILRQDR